MKALLGALALILWTGVASAATCSSVPFIFVNGAGPANVIDATQVNANFQATVNCINSNVAPLISPALLGTPTTPTATFGTNTTQIANTAFVQAAVPVSANPNATAGPAAINGVAATFMRSDAAPAIQKATNALFGIVETDNTTITATGGVITTANTTVAGVACTPGASCAIPASGLSNGVTGTGAVVLAAGAALTGSGSIDDTSWTHLNLATSSGAATACWSTFTPPAILQRIASNTCVASDKRLKTNFIENVPGLDVIEKLRPVSFDWADVQQAEQSGRQIGLVAQDVKALLPEIVTTGGDRTITLADGTKQAVDGMQILDYSKLTVPLIVAVQQQQGQITQLWWALISLLVLIAFAGLAVVYKRIW